MKSLLCSVYTDQHSAFLFNNIQVFDASSTMSSLTKIFHKFFNPADNARIDAGGC